MKDSSRFSIRRPVWRYGLVCVGAALLFNQTACQPEHSDASPMPGTEAHTEKLANIPVATLQVDSSSLVEVFEVIGQTEPLDTLRITAEIPGLIDAAPFKKGQFVSKGEVLYRIDTEVDKARLNILKSQVAIAERELERMKKLSADGLGTPQQLEQAESTLENAQLNLRQSQIALTKSAVKSPITGHITQKYAESGEYAAPGNPMAEVVDYSTIVIKAHIPESNIQYITDDKELDVEIVTLNKTLKGTVKHRAIQPSQPTRTYPIEIHIPNDELSILPGMRARVVVPKRNWDNAIIVPREAILEGVNQQEAMVVEKDSDNTGIARIRPVELGPGQGASVVITAGLEIGDELIVRGHRGLVSGTNVEVVETN